MLEAKTKSVRKGTICYGSELGHYNFWYPVEEKQGIFNSDAVVKPLRWNSHRKDLIAVFVKRIHISNIELVKNRENIVVWVPANSIQKW